jgi:SAM-dependent methyltransferase
VIDGDARRLAFPAAAFDVVLILGPLFHLVQAKDRARALREARRVLKPGGLLVAAALSRFAPLLDAFVRGHLGHPAFAGKIWTQLATGRHVARRGGDGWFTTAYLHRPEEFKSEIARAGFQAPALFALEGPAWLAPDLDRRWKRRSHRNAVLRALRGIERDPALLGASAHMLAVARKPPAARRAGRDGVSNRSRTF